MSRLYGYVRARQLEGSFPGDVSTGCWQTSMYRILKGWGSPRESAWPYETGVKTWPPVEPAGLDKLAKRNRIGAYQRVRTLEDCKRLLSSGRGFQLAVDIDRSWFSAPGGRIEMPAKNSESSGRHSFLVMGYDNSTGCFKFVNSWGRGWGDRGFGYLPYEYFDVRQLEAWFTASRTHRNFQDPLDRIDQLQWTISDPFGNLLRVLELRDTKFDEIIGWSFLVESSQYIDLEELFVRPTWRGAGYGSAIVNGLPEFATDLGKELRIWIPHSDFKSLQQQQAIRLFQRLGMKIYASPERWATALGTMRIHMKLKGYARMKRSQLGEMFLTLLAQFASRIEKWKEFRKLNKTQATSRGSKLKRRGPGHRKA